MWSPASAIFASIDTILVSFKAILMYFKASKLTFKVDSYRCLFLSIQILKYIKIASKLTSIVTIIANIALAGDHILQVLAQYS